MEAYQEIIDSYFNGQGKQMVKQINEFTLYDFVTYLQEDDTLNDSQKFEIMVKYVRIYS